MFALTITAFSLQQKEICRGLAGQLGLLSLLLPAALFLPTLL